MKMRFLAVLASVVFFAGQLSARPLHFLKSKKFWAGVAVGAASAAAVYYATDKGECRVQTPKGDPDGPDCAVAHRKPSISLPKHAH